MKTAHLFGLVALAATGFSAGGAPKPYSTWMADSQIARTVPKTRYYTESVFYRGVEYVYNKTGDASYQSFIQSQIDSVLTDNGQFKEWRNTSDQLDSIRIGSVLLRLYEWTGSAKYKTAADFIHSELMRHARTPSGGFWHKDPEYPNQMWLDGLYMAGPFSAHYTYMFEPTNTTAWDDIALQFDLIEKYCRNATTGLIVHGYDESKKAVWADPETGASPHVWNRALGWYAMALVDVLDYFPTDHPGHARLLVYLETLAAALVRHQGLSGGYWLIMDPELTHKTGNYIESSGTAMFAYSLLKGVRQRYLSAAESGKYVGAASRAYGLLREVFATRKNATGVLDFQGTVRVGSLVSSGSYEYYISQMLFENSLLGVGSFIMASAEFEMRCENKHV